MRAVIIMMARRKLYSEVPNSKAVATRAEESTDIKRPIVAAEETVGGTCKFL
jgi:hypothetical protein